MKYISGLEYSNDEFNALDKPTRRKASEVILDLLLSPIYHIPISVTEVHIYFGLDVLRTSNTSTIKADLFLAGCKLIGVILAKASKKTKLYKSIRKLVSAVA